MSTDESASGESSADSVWERFPVFFSMLDGAARERHGRARLLSGLLYAGRSADPPSITDATSVEEDADEQDRSDA